MNIVKSENTINVLMFHEVSSSFPSGFYKNSNYRYVISGDEFKYLIDLSVDISNKYNILFNYTFDDGGKSNLFSAQYLSNKGLKGIFFIPTRYIGNEGFLSKDDIISLINDGHEIGSHSHNHPMFINRYNYEAQKIEWLQSYEILSKITKKEIISASFPNGLYNNDTLKILDNLGIKNIYSSIPKMSFIKYNHLKLYGRFAIKSGMKNRNQKLVESNPIICFKELVRYHTLKTIKNYLPNFIINRSYSK